MADTHLFGRSNRLYRVLSICHQCSAARWAQVYLLTFGVAACLAQSLRADDGDAERYQRPPRRQAPVPKTRVEVDPDYSVGVEQNPTVVVGTNRIHIQPAEDVTAPDSTTAPDPAITAAANTPYIIQMRGPVHEAFAQPVVFAQVGGFVAPRPPPRPIEEILPDVAPKGENMEWIPGYWAWDDERVGFLWISGVWRNRPPGRQWNPGYWTRSTSGGWFEWVPGYWQSDRVEKVRYLPEPPEPREIAAVGNPQPHSVWSPGTWLWRENTYVWKPGRWVTLRDNSVWVSDHYTWTPGGYVFVSGYLDYPVDGRGVLFAPAYVLPGLTSRARLTFAPTVVVNPALLVDHLFVRPEYDHYYFGDYYTRGYYRAGIGPAYMFYTSGLGFDPLFAAHIARQSMSPNAVVREARQEYNFRITHLGARPPRTFALLRQLADRDQVTGGVMTGLALAQPLNEAIARGELPLEFQRIEPTRNMPYPQALAQAPSDQEEEQPVAARQPPRTPVASGRQHRIIGTPIGPTSQRPAASPMPPQTRPEAATTRPEAALTRPAVATATQPENQPVVPPPPKPIEDGQ